jgi:transglutaminase-like putative cysteine protease
LEHRHGICYAKSHLLAALLRSIGIPAGFCYQWLVFSDDDPRIVLHGLVGVYIQEKDRWIRLDARGNKPGVDAQFSLEEEKLAFPVRKEFGEYENFTVYPDSSENVIDSLLKSKNVKELIGNLPDSL